jgi:two-component system sensor histidine kinase/response regulator
MTRRDTSLPASGRSVHPTAAIGAPAFVAPTREQAVRDGRLVLVAEDNPINQNLIVLQLGMLGVAADVAGDGKMALEHWQAGDYALLLCDLQMPAMDGHALTALIRDGEGAHRRIPIVALSADPSQSEADYCLTNGMDDYLTKPVPLDRLKAALERWLPVAPVDVTGATTLESTDDTATVDVAVLMSLIGSDPAVVTDFLRSFQVGAGAIALELERACLRSDTGGARQHAHKLMSSARSIGARSLGELCAQMTNAGKAGDGPALTVLWPLFEQEFEAVNARLDELQAEYAFS